MMKMPSKTECGSIIAACWFVLGHVSLAFKNQRQTEFQIAAKFWWFYLLGTAAFIGVLLTLKAERRR
jgi:hypothetical protein